MGEMDGKARIETIADVQGVVTTGEVRNCLIYRQDLAAVILDEVLFKDVDLIEIGLAGASACGARLSSCTVRGVDVKGVNLAETIMEDVTFHGCEAMEAVFRESRLSGVTMEDCPSGNADFSGAELINVVFSASDLYSADFSGAVVVRSRYENLRLGNAVLSGADFSGGVILDTDFSSADLAGAVFRDSMLVRTNFKGANITGADFSGAIMVGANFAQVSADDATRVQIMKGVAGPDRAGARIMEFLAARKSGILKVVHSLIVGYVLGDVRPDVQAAPEGIDSTGPSNTGTANADAGDRQEIDGQPEVEDAQEATEQNGNGKSKVAREPQQLYERFKKIELD